MRDILHLKGGNYVEWTVRINKALDYIESNLDADIDIKYAARLAFCSPSSLLNAFSVLTGMQLSEYIRRRRLSLAALDIQIGKEKMIDIGSKYGYSSPTAFNRAFQNQHKVSPQYARSRRISLSIYPRITFQIQLKGDIEMKLKIEKKEAFTVVGIKTALAYDNNTPKNFWLETSDEMYSQMESMANGEPKGLLGVVANFRESDFDYYVAVATSHTETPYGLEKLKIPAASWAIFQNEGNIQELISRFRDEWLPSSGYMRADYDIPDIEIYHNGDLRNDTFGYELWFPVKKE